MGYAMAANIRRNMAPSATLFVYDVYRPSCERFVAEFGTARDCKVKMVDSPKEAASHAQVIVSIIPTAANVREVYLDETNGVLAAPRLESRLILECSTIDAATARDVGGRLAAEGAGTYVDTPVSGGVPAAEAGTLSFLIGHAKPENQEQDQNQDQHQHQNQNLQPSHTPPARRIEATVSMMGAPNKIFWCGKLGAGLACKISNNYISCTVLLVVAEAMAIGVKSGVDPKLLYEVIHHSTGQTFMGDHVSPVPGVVAHAPSSNGWRLGFKTQMMTKDIGLGIEVAKELGIEPNMANAALDVWKAAAQDSRCIDRDGSSVWLRIVEDHE
ncbi:hypothetical protein A1O3_03732 [Capronia epimyces CBS 606.96]|uniref:3-hydroxyisobutyrate dehydrogenase n=1 Tax=Capronia epimyces CBS 606.96 TaxID=1182542 RepID=W9Y2P5_9EURO|nr:uncharacterized protein A1O3_03732 [Capronia epimyces CBS 606.96]EXJ86778.1 hypothetical protein A1O3_03732 [Capronia epimyces CBS 606.96]